MFASQAWRQWWHTALETRRRSSTYLNPKRSSSTSQSWGAPQIRIQPDSKKLSSSWLNRHTAAIILKNPPITKPLARTTRFPTLAKFNIQLPCNMRRSWYTVSTTKPRDRVCSEPPGQPRMGRCRDTVMDTTPYLCRNCSTLASKACSTNLLSTCSYICAASATSNVVACLGPLQQMHICGQGELRSPAIFCWKIGTTCFSFHTENPGPVTRIRTCMARPPSRHALRHGARKKDTTLRRQLGFFFLASMTTRSCKTLSFHKRVHIWCKWPLGQRAPS